MLFIIFHLGGFVLLHLTASSDHQLSLPVLNKIQVHSGVIRRLNRTNQSNKFNVK